MPLRRAAPRRLAVPAVLLGILGTRVGSFNPAMQRAKGCTPRPKGGDVKLRAYARASNQRRSGLAPRGSALACCAGRTLMRPIPHPATWARPSWRCARRRAKAAAVDQCLAGPRTSAGCGAGAVPFGAEARAATAAERYGCAPLGHARRVLWEPRPRASAETRRTGRFMQNGNCSASQKKSCAVLGQAPGALRMPCPAGLGRQAANASPTLPACAGSPSAQRDLGSRMPCQANGKRSPRLRP